MNASASQKESDRETSWSFQLDKRGSDVSMLTPYGSETIVPLISAHETIDLYKRDASSEENTDRSTLAFLMDEVRLTFSLAFGKPALPVSVTPECCRGGILTCCCFSQLKTFQDYPGGVLLH